MKERILKGNWHRIHEMWERWGKLHECPCLNCFENRVEKND